jgi:hypothetical protein
LQILTTTTARSSQVSSLKVKHCRVLLHLYQFNVMAYLSLILMMMFGRMWVWMMNMMVGFHSGLVMRRYAQGFMPYPSMIDAVRRSFG